MLGNEERGDQGACTAPTCTTVDEYSLVRDKYAGVVAFLCLSAGLLDHLTSHVGHSLVVLMGVTTTIGCFVVLPGDVGHLGELVDVFALQL